MPRFRAAALSACLAACLFAACIPPESPPSPDPRVREIEKARARWKLKAPARFSYNFRVVCYCPPESLRVEAMRDSVISVTNLVNITGLPAPSRGEQGYAIDSALLELERIALANPDELRMSFDPVYGFPDSVFIDWVKQGIDDEERRYIDGFQAEAGP